MSQGHTVQELLKFFRKEQGLSRAELSRRSGVTPWRILYLESTIGSYPRPRESVRLAEALEIRQALIEDAILTSSLIAEANRERQVAS